MKPIKAILGASILSAALGAGCLTHEADARMAVESYGFQSVTVNDYQLNSAECKTFVIMRDDSPTAYFVSGVDSLRRRYEGVVCCIPDAPCAVLYWNRTQSY